MFSSLQFTRRQVGDNHTGLPRVATWRILEETNLRLKASEISGPIDPSEVSTFLFNLSKVSVVKLHEWIDAVPISQMVNVLSRASIKYFARILKIIHKTDEMRFNLIIQDLDLSIICDKFLVEQNLWDLKIAIAHLAELLPGKLDVRAGSNHDFTGEWSTKVSLYVENRRVIRIITGRRLGIPYSHSSGLHTQYAKWLFNNRICGVWITLDQGAEKAVLKYRASLFPVGVSKVQGTFQVGDIVEVRNEKGEVIGAGVSNFASFELDDIKGLRSSQISDSFQNLTPNRVFDNDLFVRRNNLALQ